MFLVSSPSMRKVVGNDTAERRPVVKRDGLGTTLTIDVPDHMSADLAARVVRGALASVQAAAATVAALDQLAELPGPSTVRAAHDTVEAWRELERRWGLLSPVEVVERNPTVSNASDHLGRLHDAGRVVRVRRGRGYRYPGYQFDGNGQPIAALADVVVVLRRAGWSEPSIVLWFDSPNGRLVDDARPAELLASDADAVRAAASAAADPLW
jgi:hypothetical protein